MRRGFKGVWIPRHVWENTELTWMEKLLIVEVDSLQDVKRGGCYASNGYFGEFFNLSNSRISALVSSLSRKGYIRVYLKKHTRNGQITLSRIIRITPKGVHYPGRGYADKNIPPSVSAPGCSVNSERIYKLITKENILSACATKQITPEDIKDPFLKTLVKRIKGVDIPKEKKEVN